eukprot:366203-Chlamydomonas_euryale.AAC.10
MQQVECSRDDHGQPAVKRLSWLTCSASHATELGDDVVFEVGDAPEALLPTLLHTPVELHLGAVLVSARRVVAQAVLPGQLQTANTASEIGTQEIATQGPFGSHPCRLPATNVWHDHSNRMNDDQGSCVHALLAFA